MSIYKAIEHMSMAMIAWDEIWQGYRDHWSKVYGNMKEAANCCPRKIAYVIDEQADKFLNAFRRNNKHRPPFERINCGLLNALNEEEIVTVTMSSQLCYDCAMKHLSEALVAVEHLYDDDTAWMKVIGNLCHAANHLVGRHPDLSNFIRGVRKQVMSDFENGIDPVIDDIHYACMKVKDIMEG